MTRLLIILLILVTACGRIKNKADMVVDKTKDKIINELKEPIISNASLFDKFPELKNEKYKIDFKQGVKCEYLPAFYKYYFTYYGNKSKVLDFISQIKCTYTEIVPDTICKRIDFAEFQKGKSGLTDLEKQKTDFFYKYQKLNSTNLELYDCIKTPEHNFIIFDTKTGMIYHMIENFNE